MNKIYFIIVISAFVFGAYFYGADIAESKCREAQMQNNIVEIQQLQKNKRDIHEKVYKTGTADIRSILRDKYTIAE